MSSLHVDAFDEFGQAPEPVTTEVFRSVFRDHAARVVVVTAPGRGAPAGFTATSLTSVSLQPPLVSVAVARSASSWATVSRSERLGVHLLGEDQDWIARNFATSGIDRFAEVCWRTAPGGAPLIEGCAAYLGCQVVQQVPAGDHVLLLARVEEARINQVGSPLIYHDGAYSSVHPAAHDRPTPLPRRSLSR